MKQCISILVMWCYTLLPGTTAMAAEIDISEPWVREAPPNARALAAFMKIVNNSAHAVELTGASSPDFRMIEIHRTKLVGGMAQMMKEPSLLIAAGSSVVLEPGSWHLMLMQPVHSLQAGAAVKLQLRFSNGELIDVTAIPQRR